MHYIYKHKKQSTNNYRATVQLPREIEHLRDRLGACRLVDVVSALKEVTQVTTNEMRTDYRAPALVEARQLFYYFAYMLKKDSVRQPYRYTTPQLAGMLYQQHCSVLHGKKVTERVMSVDKRLREKIIHIANLIITKNEQFRTKLQTTSCHVCSATRWQS